MEQQYRCICNAPLSSRSQIKKHIQQCQQYLRRCFFLPNLQRIPKDVNINDLQLLRAEVELTGQKIREAIKRIQNPNKQQKVNVQIPKQEQKIEIKDQKQQQIMTIEETPYAQFDQGDSSQIIACLNCKNKFFADYDIGSLSYIEECWHLFCKPCIIRHIDKQFVEQNGNLKCLEPDCPIIIQSYIIQDLIGNEKFNQLSQKVVKKISNIIACVNCHAEFIFEEGKPEALKDATGKPLTKQMETHYAQNRFNCYNCKTQQCKKCFATPYHVGKTCEQFKQHSQALKCRYCTDVMAQKNTKTGIKAFEDICNKKQCQQQVKLACAKIHRCGHPCRGVANQKHCLPCLVQQCSENNVELLGQKGDDYCAICYVQALDSSPSVRSVCGHIFHQKCLAKRFEIRWIGPRILFNFCVCPLCKKWIQLPQDNPLLTKISDNHIIYEKIKSKCAQRLKFEGCQKDQKLIDPSSHFFEKPTEYALAIFAYYQCFKCKQPYFGGRKACQNAMQQNQGKFDQKELICSNCCQIPVQNCQKHGKDYIQFKCRFCCSIAQWFCWGNTHFCQSCHSKQCKGQYVSKYPKDKLPKCLGPDKCPVGGNHQGNGDQKPLGCAICRNMKESNKNF